MNSINIFDLSGTISIKVSLEFLLFIKTKIFNLYKTKRKFFFQINDIYPISFKTFSCILKESHQKKFFVPLKLWLAICLKLEISYEILQKQIIAYKTTNGPNYIYNPILPVKVTPLFDMIVAHNIADGTVIFSKNRQSYFGYRQFDNLFRELYIKKLEAIFGSIYFPNKYYLNSTRAYCPAVLANFFFDYYSLNGRQFLSRTARVPKSIFSKDRDFLLAFLIAFIIDEGNIDSTTIVIGLKNIHLAKDLKKICNLLDYKVTFSISGEYGIIFILREGMVKFFNDYKKLIIKYPEVNMGKIESKIKKGFEIYNRPFYKTYGNREIIFNLVKFNDLTVNEIASEVNMTRQGVRWHIHNLEEQGLIVRNGFSGKNNIVYSYRRR